MSSALETVQRNNKRQDSTRNHKYAVALSSATFILSLIVVVMHLSSVSSIRIVNTPLEGFLCLIFLGLQAATVAVVTEPNNNLAVMPVSAGGGGGVINGNLYYFSWAGFVMSVIISVSYFRSMYHIDVAGEIRSRSARLIYWAILLAASLVVMGSSANIFDADCSATEENRLMKYCNRTAFAISLGTLGTIASLLIVVLKIITPSSPFTLEAFLSLTLFIINAFGVAYVTSSYGPGAPLGNIYYFSWISFIATFYLCSSCYEDYLGATIAGDASQRQKEDTMENEEEDDTI